MPDSTPGQPPVSPQDVGDLYHTGGPFSAKGLDRPFTQIVFRVGEIGNPKMRVRDRVVDFKIRFVTLNEVKGLGLAE